MRTLHEHIQKQHDAALDLCGILEALYILDHHGEGPGAVTSLIMVARRIADGLSDNLDCVALPKGGAA